jgi:hypothetical protein
MSKITELATAQLTATETITVELIEANEHRQWSSSGGRAGQVCSMPVASLVPLRVQHASSRPLPYGWQRSSRERRL